MFGKRQSPQTKTCTRCKTEKPVDEFNLSRGAKDGRQSWCKQCRQEHREANREAKAAYDRARYEADPEKHRARARAERATNPEYLKTYNSIYYREHAQEATENARKWRNANPEKRRAISSRHKAAKRNADGRFTDADIHAMLNEQEGRCVYCRRDISDCYTVDHVIPLSRGGSNWPQNLQLLCASCNSSKKDRTHDEYLAHLRIVATSRR